MKSVIRLFLDKQKPILIHVDKDIGSNIYFKTRIWLGEGDTIYSFCVPYTKLSLYNTTISSSLEDTLNQLIVTHDTYLDAVAYTVQLEKQFSSEVTTQHMVCFADYILQKASSIGIDGIELLSFSCIDSALGIFTLAYRCQGHLDTNFLVVGDVNAVFCNADDKYLVELLMHSLFSGIIQYVVLTRGSIEVEGMNSYQGLLQC